MSDGSWGSEVKGWKSEDGRQKTEGERRDIEKQKFVNHND